MLFGSWSRLGLERDDNVVVRESTSRAATSSRAKHVML